MTEIVLEKSDKNQIKDLHGIFGKEVQDEEKTKDPNKKEIKVPIFILKSLFELAAPELSSMMEDGDIKVLKSYFKDIKRRNKGSSLEISELSDLDFNRLERRQKLRRDLKLKTKAFVKENQGKQIYVKVIFEDAFYKAKVLSVDPKDKSRIWLEVDFEDHKAKCFWYLSDVYDVEKHGEILFENKNKYYTNTLFNVEKLTQIKLEKEAQDFKEKKGNK